MRRERRASRRRFLACGLGGGAAIRALAASPPAPAAAAQQPRPLVIDGMMHLEVYDTPTRASYWEGLVEEVIEHYDRVGIDQGVIMTVWTPSRRSNDRTLKAYEKYPKRFIPFGHVRPEDPEWKSELKRVSEPPWKGLKLHESEMRRAGNLRETARMVARKAAEAGIRVIKMHVDDLEFVAEIARELSEVTWILPHMGCYGALYDAPARMQKYCELARGRSNVYLDTSGVIAYYDLGKAFRQAGIDKITFASDGFMLSPLVEKAKIETLRLPTPYRTPRLSDGELAQILGGNMARILKE